MSGDNEIVMRDVTNAGLVVSDRIGRDVASQIDLEDALEASRYASHPYTAQPREVTDQFHTTHSILGLQVSLIVKCVGTIIFEGASKIPEFVWKAKLVFGWRGGEIFSQKSFFEFLEDLVYQRSLLLLLLQFFNFQKELSFYNKAWTKSSVLFKKKKNNQNRQSYEDWKKILQPFFFPSKGYRYEKHL